MRQKDSSSLQSAISNIPVGCSQTSLTAPLSAPPHSGTFEWGGTYKDKQTMHRSRDEPWDFDTAQKRPDVHKIDLSLN